MFFENMQRKKGHCKSILSKQDERKMIIHGFDREHGCVNLMEGFRVHYNLVKSHQALGCTPSEATWNIDINGFRWHDIIQKATQY